MAFKGLFVGIDRYGSSMINWLGCAVRDATAMHALFSDTFGGDATLLVDEQATRGNLEKEFERLVNSAEDDFVLIYFSGHGTETHELVTHDANPWDFHRTAIPLDLLTKWFTLIPSKRVVCVLDCCFSGGMGAKALQMDNQPRDVESEENLLAQLSGEGRLIFTASGAKEKSWENQRLGHGWMTYFLLEALQGTEETVKEGKIGIYSLLEYVTRKVVDATSKVGKKQNPAIRGSMDGEFKLPLLKPGSIFYAVFPERKIAEVIPQINSLSIYGFPPDLIDIWSKNIPSLNALQLDAVNKFGVLRGESLVVSAPTSSGKTMIGELAALKGAIDRKRALFLFPMKALVNDKYKYFIETYGSFGIKTIKATGDSTTDDMRPLMRGQYDICLLTYEKFSSLVLTNAFLLEQVNTIVVDEVQMITDKTRGANLEFILTLLKVRKAEKNGPQMICLSAVIGETNGLERWLGARLLKRTERPVPLDEGIIKSDGGYKFIDSSDNQEKTLDNFVTPEYGKPSSQMLIKPLVKRLVNEGKQVIVFREKRGDATGCANYLVPLLGLPPAQEVMDKLPTGDPSVSTSKLRSCLSGGVAFHISDLDPEERVLVEEEFRKPESKIRVIVATTTLAMGINTPTEAVIVAGLMHPENVPYSIAEYKNIVGRAGRLGKSTKGASYLVALSSSDAHHYWSRYVKGQPEDIKSQLFSRETDPRSLIIKVLVAAQKSAAQGLSENDVVSFIEESFGSFQERLRDQSWKWSKETLINSLSNLVSHKLINREVDGTYQLSDLGRLSGETGIEVESIIRLVDAFKSVDPAEINDPTLLAAAQITIEVDKQLFTMHPNSQSEPNQWLNELRGQNICGLVFNNLSRYVSNARQPGLRAKKAVACLLWITDKQLNEIESLLTQTWGRFDGVAGYIRSVRGRVIDVLPTVARVGEILHPTLNLKDRLTKLLVRLEIGVPSGVADLAMLVGGRLSRSDYLTLFRNGVGTIEQIKAISDEVLLSYLSGDELKLQMTRELLDRSKEDQNQPTGPVLSAYEA